MAKTILVWVLLATRLLTPQEYLEHWQLLAQKYHNKYIVLQNKNLIAVCRPDGRIVQVLVVRTGKVTTILPPNFTPTDVVVIE